MDPVYVSYKVAIWLWKHKLSFAAFFIRGLMRIVFACDIPYKTRIGKNVLFPHHALGIVIHPNVKIGDNCTIRQNVTIGGRNEIEVVPVIGDNVSIGAGAVILGPVNIVDNVFIGANAVVIRDVPSDCVVVGVPEKIVKYRGECV